MSHTSLPDRPLRIALFTETFLPKIDGIVSILCLTLQRLQELGHQVMLFGPPGGPERYSGADIVGVGGPPLPFYPELRINLPRRAHWQRFADFAPDVTHVANPFFLGPFGITWARRAGVPLVASFHTDLARYVAHYGAGFLAPLLWTYMRTLHNRAHITLCPSTSVREDLRRHGFQRVRWWQRGIDTELFSPGPRTAAMRERLTGGHPHEFLLLNVGRQAPEKGLEQLREHLGHETGVRLALVGGGPGHAALKQHFAGAPAVLPGYMQGQELVDAYRAADAFIFPSTTETFGLVALEAMACGLPVIAARTGGVLDTVQDGVNGLFFAPAQPAGMRPLVRRLRDDAPYRAQLGAAALAHARSRSWRATIDQLAGYYMTAIRLFHLHRRPGTIDAAG